MVFSSHPLYDQLDPPDWQYHQHQQQQQMILYGVGNEISNSITTPQHPPLQQPPLAATSGSRNIRPGSMTDRARMAKVPLPETSLKCPRCESTNTKFCYFNNYSLTQPRHFCKTCRRYWTRGGALRNVPVGGGCRRSATKRSGKKRSKSPAISSGTATATTTTTSTDQNGNNNMNMVDDGILNFPLLNPNGSLNQMVHVFGDHYIGGGNNNNNNNKYNYGGSYTDPHIAKLVQTGVISSTDSSTDYHQWNKHGVTTLTQMHSLPFPFLTNLAQQEHYYSSQLLFNQCSGHQLGLTGSSQVEAPTMDEHQTIAADQVTNVKMENEERGLKRFLELRALERSHTSMASGNGQLVGNWIGNTWSDVIDFTSNEETTGQNSL